jgi:hypothetical protein
LRAYQIVDLKNTTYDILYAPLMTKFIKFVTLLVSCVAEFQL